MLRISKTALALATLALFACSPKGYMKHDDTNVTAFRKRQYLRSAFELKNGSREIGPDRLLFILDLAMSYHALGRYKQSNTELWEASKLMGEEAYKDRWRLQNRSNWNNRVHLYRGEEYEFIGLSAVHAINYALIGADEDAILECQRVRRKIVKYRDESDRNYSLNPFLHYLSGILYERKFNWKNAYLEYKNTFSLISQFPSLRKDLLRSTIKLNSELEQALWRRNLSAREWEFREAFRSLRDTGSVVVIIENGFIGGKRPHGEIPDLPAYQNPFAKYRSAKIFVNGEEKSETVTLFDIDRLARENFVEIHKQHALENRRASIEQRNRIQLMRNRTAELTQNPGSDEIAKLTADLRYWQTLPRNIQVARIQLRPGMHNVALRMVGVDGKMGVSRDLGIVEIEKVGDIRILLYREIND